MNRKIRRCLEGKVSAQSKDNQCEFGATKGAPLKIRKANFVPVLKDIKIIRLGRCRQWAIRHLKNY